MARKVRLQISASTSTNERSPLAEPPIEELGVSADTVLLVGDLARATGKTVRAIHLYEDLGLLRPHDRSKGRYRLFGPDALVRVRWITKLQSLGFSLSDIQELVRAQGDSESAKLAASRLSEVYLTKLAETRAKLDELAQLERELVESLSYLNACGSACEPRVPVHACPNCERHSDSHTPDLVAGAQTH
ncbi:MAG: MerR family transcriptional regulator [Polyangiaceae bacterium]|nr:MerR family transcriptional regulator [Polyangiaceae bacterium]